MVRRPRRSSQALAYGVVLFGHVGPELRRRWSALIHALDRVAGSVIHFFGHGPRREGVGENAAQYLKGSGLLERRYTAEWNAIMERESGQDAAIAKVDEEFIATHGISRSQLPCIAFFLPGASAPFTIIELDPESWETPSRFKRLSSVLLSSFEAGKVEAAVSNTAIPKSTLENYIRRAAEEVAALAHDPDDLITIAVAIREFCVSRSTIERLIATGKIKSFRPHNASKTSKHFVSRKALAAIYPRRGKAQTA